MIAARTKCFDACRGSVALRGVFAYPGVRHGRRIDQQERASAFTVARRSRPDGRFNVCTEVVGRDAKKVEQVNSFECEYSLFVCLTTEVIEGRQSLSIRT